MRYEGLTLPNMIGAYYCHDNAIDLSSSKCVAFVLEDIISSQKDMKVLIHCCANIRNYVLSPFIDKHSQLLKLDNKIFLHMYDPNLQKHSSSVNDLAEYLYSIHYKEITEKKFSFTEGVWQPLSNEELGHISAIIATL